MRTSASWILVAVSGGLVAGPAIAAPAPVPTPAPQFAFCAASTFANCTTAKCTPKTEGGWACECFLDSRYSATAYDPGCVAATSTTAQSRYHPVASYQECNDTEMDTPVWAWCLGVTCNASGNSPRAICNCTDIPPNVRPFPYVVVTPTYLPQGCHANPREWAWSSATVGDVTAITSFLQGQPGLENLPAPRVIAKPQ